MSSIILSTFVVRSSNGSVDSDATMAKFQSTLSSFISESETESETIGSAIEAVLETHKGSRVNLDFLVSSTCRALNAQPENFKVLGDKVRQFVKDNSCDKNDAGMPSDSTKRLNVARGKGGGVGRWSDLLAAK